MSQKYLCFVAQGEVFQSRILCFCIAMVPQLFTRVTASVSVFLYQVGIRIFRYLDDWLILASSLEGIIRAMDYTLQLCSDVGIAVYLEKLHLIPTQEALYLGMLIKSWILKAFPAQKRMGNPNCQLERLVSESIHGCLEESSGTSVISSLSSRVGNFFFFFFKSN